MITRGVFSVRGHAMFAPFPFFSNVPFNFFNHTAISHHTCSNIIKKIKEIALCVFIKISSFFNKFSNDPNNFNLKTFAILSFLTLATLIVISIFRKNDNSPLVDSSEEK